MKKLYIGIALAGALSAPNLFAAFDGTITYVSNGGGNANGGGVFNVVTTPSVGKIALGNFGTFCIEHNEYIAGATYNYNISLGAINGGVSGGNPDMISIGTAYLYANFRQTAGFAASNQDKSDLQQAIWYLEGESPTLSVAGANGTAYYNLAKQYAVSGSPLTDAQVIADSGGAYGVVALNLYNADGSVAQDQLGLVPEPSTVVAGALLLLPFGASTIRILRKNRKA